MLFLYGLILYMLLVWVVLRLVVPYMGFKKARITETESIHLRTVVADIKQNAVSKIEALHLAYEYVTHRYYGSRIKTVLNFWRAFGSCEHKSPGFLPCNMQNQLLRTMLIKSDCFSDADIQVRVVPFNLFIHQYLQVKIDGQLIDVDPWSHFLGLKIGEKSSWFG